ncbi:Calcineurin-like phosphoesterase superfamily domain protein [Novipirellula galeiformis]|uniref:Calcineurin-like phosphoesterase superfamily domain protein n=1 Tax=Novipirellula galeiformis TaxID=2528004 RepID=A0A5C6CGL3_9BACT|nr:metallophosphoesterase [Novipirellula galeiformis]TWU23332.1 Calcineurin-like phosphoesterase superfamily domain protein [Novipirellula galeiformis]
MRIAWITDPHLNHVSPDRWDQWCDRIASMQPDALLITGDISEGDDVELQLRRTAERFAVPLYFVLGNHDFYQSSIAQTRQNVIAASRDHNALNYLTDRGPVALADGVYLVGEDGWGDATVGNYDESFIRLNDFKLIDDFREISDDRWKAKLQQLGADSAARLQVKLNAVPRNATQILVATHVPPFRESCWYEGKTTDDHWAPFFVCGEVGRTLMEFCQRRVDCQTTVICGHTHHDGIATLRENLIVHTGSAVYGAPDVEAVIEVTANELHIAGHRR